MKLKPCPFCKSVVENANPYGDFWNCTNEDCPLFHAKVKILYSQWQSRPIEEQQAEQIRDKDEFICKYFPNPFEGNLADEQPTYQDIKAENKRLKELVEAKDELLVCYRLGRRPTEKLMKKLDKLKAALADERD